MLFRVSYFRVNSLFFLIDTIGMRFYIYNIANYGFISFSFLFHSIDCFFFIVCFNFHRLANGLKYFFINNFYIRWDTRRDLGICLFYSICDYLL